jgi:hypothetical protein
MGFIKDTIGAITGSSAADAATKGAQLQAGATQDAIQAQKDAAVRAQEFLQPFGQVGQQALDQSSFLTDPNQQFQFLQENPLFKLALENANRQTQQTAAAGSRSSAGDTLQQLSNNVLLQASPLIGQQKQSIAGLLDFGRGVATSQANVETGVGSQISPLLQDIGNIQAAGGIGAANARAGGVSNLIGLGGAALGAGLVPSFPSFNLSGTTTPTASQGFFGGGAGR